MEEICCSTDVSVIKLDFLLFLFVAVTIFFLLLLLLPVTRYYIYFFFLTEHRLAQSLIPSISREQKQWLFGAETLQQAVHSFYFLNQIHHFSK